MDVRLPAQLRRPLQVPGPVCFVSQIGQAAPVDPLGPARPLQRPVRRLLPRLTGLLQPVPGLGLPRLPRPPLLRGLRVVALEPLLPAALDPVMAPLGKHQVRVGVLSVRPAPVDGQRIRQPLLGAHPFGELACKLPPIGLAELLGKRELDLAVQPAVGAFVLVRRPPSTLRGRPRPTPACSRALCVPVPRRPSRSAPRARCNRSWRGPTARRRGNRS